MLLIVGTIRLPADKVDAARSVMARMLEMSRVEDGCVEYRFAEDVIEPGLIHITERWRDQAALDAHRASAHMAEWRAAGGELGVGDRQLSMYDVGEPL